jgi:hypothetical protein
MKYRILSFLYVMALTCGASVVNGAQSVDILKSFAPESGTAYYAVTLDFGGADDYDAHFIIGQKYAESLLKIFREQGGFEIAVSACLRKSLDEIERSGLRFKDMMVKVTELMGQAGSEGNEYYLAGAEIEGMNSVFNSSRNGYSSSDRLWWLIFNENQLTLRELYLLNMISNGLVSQVQDISGKQSVKRLLEGFKAVYTIKNRGNKKDQICEGFLGCLFNTVKTSSEEKMLSGFNTGNHDGSLR